VFSLNNVSVSDRISNVHSFSTSSAFLIDASPSAVDPQFIVELKSVIIINISIIHIANPSKGLISISPADSTVSDVVVDVLDLLVKDVKVDLNTTNGGVFFLKGLSTATFSNTSFISSGGSVKGGAVYLEGCEKSTFTDVIFDNVSVVSSSNSKGGAVYAEVEDTLSRVSGSITFDGGLFNNCSALQGRGGAVYLKFSQIINCDDSFIEYRNSYYYFNETLFTNNKGVNGTNVFLEAYNLNDIFSNDNFKVSLTFSGVGINEFVGYENCPNDECPNCRFVSIAGALLVNQQFEGSYVYVSSGEFECPFADETLCSDFADALSSGNFSNFTIEIINAASLNDAVIIYGNGVLIEPAIAGTYVVLSIGLNGIIYVESGTLPTFSLGAGHLSNDLESGNLTFLMMDIILAYKVGHTANPFTVVKSGTVTFNSCLFRSGSEDFARSNYVSLYIAMVMNSGKLVLKSSNIRNIQVDGDVLINGCDSSTIKIEV
jgi:hypothetical protein